MHSLKSSMQKYPQTLMNIELQKPVKLADYPAIDEIVKEVEKQLDKPGRILLRPSGTEPLLRVMVEGSDSEKVRLLAQRLAGDIDNIISE